MRFVTLTDPAGEPVHINTDAIIRIRIEHPRTVVDLTTGMQFVKETVEQVLAAIKTGTPS